MCQLTDIHPLMGTAVTVVFRFYGEPIPGNVLCERIASYKHMYNLYWWTR